MPMKNRYIMDNRPFTTNTNSALVIMSLASILAIITSTVNIIEVDSSQIVTALLICIRGFAALAMLWASFSMWIMLRINKEKDVLVFTRWARAILFAVAILIFLLIGVYMFVSMLW